MVLMEAVGRWDVCVGLSPSPLCNERTPSLNVVQVSFVRTTLSSSEPSPVLKVHFHPCVAQTPRNDGLGGRKRRETRDEQRQLAVLGSQGPILSSCFVYLPDVCVCVRLEIDHPSAEDLYC